MREFAACGLTGREDLAPVGTLILSGAVNSVNQWQFQAGTEREWVRLVGHLRTAGWAIDFTADTAGRGRGEDIVASRPGRKLVVEVKGYPSTVYRDPRRAGEVKRTNPTLQAKHWYAEVVLKLMRLRSLRPGVELAMALPEAPRYRALLAETEGSLRDLGIGVFIVTASGDVGVVLPHGS